MSQTALAVSKPCQSLCEIAVRPSTSVALRSFISEKQRLQFGLMTQDSFGAYSPQWTIPSSRRPQKPTNDFPGPCDYNVPSCPAGPKRAISPRAASRDDTVTSQIDFYRPNGILDVPPQTIGVPDGRHYFMPVPVSPPPSFVHPSFDRTKVATIGPKRPEIPPNPAPGPGRYSPTDDSLLRRPRFEFPKTVARDPFGEIPDTPGPGAYETVPQPGAPKRWAGKLRVKSKRTRAKEVARGRPWTRRRCASAEAATPK
jgi:hypothetical protein